MVSSPNVIYLLPTLSPAIPKASSSPKASIMARIFRILYRSFLVLGALVLVAGLLAYYLASQSLPDYDRDWSAEGW